VSVPLVPRDRIAAAVNAVAREDWTTAFADRVASELARRMASDVRELVRGTPMMALIATDEEIAAKMTASTDSPETPDP
jgi:hypothetical protein